MTKKEYRLGVVGIGGYAEMYLMAARYLAEQGLGQLVAAVVRSPDKYREKMAELAKQGVRFYPDLETMLKSEHLHIVGVPTGISSHVPFSIAAMEAGCDVVCEKPLCATVQEAYTLIDTRNRLGRKVAIGYQGMYSPIAHELKRRLVAGELGALQRIRCKISAPRHDGYYARNDWAGRQKDKDGRWILDSPANNANAHQLQQMLFLAGPTLLESAQPARVYAELYRGRPDIDNFDTCVIHVLTTGGAELLYIVSHCVAEAWGPETEIQCERGTVTTGGAGGGGAKGATIVRTADGREEEIRIDPGVPNLVCRAFINLIGAIEGQERLLCTPDNTWQQTLVINAAHESSGGPTPIPPHFTGTGDVQYGSRRLPGRFIRGGEEAIARAYEEWKPFSELGLPWARPARWVDTTRYEYFPGGKAPQGAPKGHA